MAECEAPVQALNALASECELSAWLGFYDLTEEALAQLTQDDIQAFDQEMQCLGDIMAHIYQLEAEVARLLDSAERLADIGTTTTDAAIEARVAGGGAIDGPTCAASLLPDARARLLAATQSLNTTQMAILGLVTAAFAR